MENYSCVKKRFVEYINNVINKNKVSHAYLIELDNYDSDLNYVYNFIKMIFTNLSYEDLEKSDEKILKLIDNGDFPDIYVVSSDTSFIQKNDLLELKKEFNNKSLYGNKKIYIIKEAEKLNVSSANTILKFLEEPSDDIYAFLLTDNRYHIIETILSRCVVFSLKEKYIDYEINDDILNFLDLVLCPYNYFIKYNIFVKNSNYDKKYIKSIFLQLESVILDYLSSNENLDSQVLSIFSNYDKKYLLSLVSIIEMELPKLNYNVNFKLWMDSFFSKLIGVGCFD